MMKFISTKWSNYEQSYRQEFSRLSNVKSVVEIGVAGGGSLYFWKEMFPGAAIYGIDIDPRCKNATGDGVEVFIGSVCDPRFMQETVRKIGAADIVIDDGKHHAIHQRAAFKHLWPILRPGGCFCVEDLGVSYIFYTPRGRFTFRWPFKRGFIRTCYRMIDALNGYHHKATPLTKEITAINFRDQMVFIYKGDHEAPYQVKTGTVDCREMQSV
jgi:SAM-dependent methyltransferase